MIHPQKQRSEHQFPPITRVVVPPSMLLCQSRFFRLDAFRDYTQQPRLRSHALAVVTPSTPTDLGAEQCDRVIQTGLVG
jgi:hypothetical protein